MKIYLPFLWTLVFRIIVFGILFSSVSKSAFSQKNAHAFLIGSPSPNAVKIEKIDGFKKEKLVFDDLSAPVATDLKNMVDWLTKSGFKTSQITQFDRVSLSVKEITAKITSVTKDLEDEALVLIYFTGHGAQKENFNTKDPESDGLDECLVLSEEVWVDDDINLFYSKNLFRFQNVMILDACFTGTSYKVTPSRRDFLSKLSRKDFADDFLKAVNGVPGCATFYSDPTEKRYSMLYYGASGDNQQAKADLSGSWLTNHLSIIVNKPSYGPAYNYRDLYCALRGFDNVDHNFIPTFIEVGDVSKYYLKQPLKINQ
jgi:hypothetical protein